MKLLAATLVFMIAAQPVQAGFCDMEMGSDAAAGPGQHHPEKAADDHGCCDPSDGDDRLPCSERMHCGSCSIGVAAIPHFPTAQQNFVSIDVSWTAADDLTQSYIVERRGPGDADFLALASTTKP